MTSATSYLNMVLAALGRYHPPLDIVSEQCGDGVFKAHVWLGPPENWKFDSAFSPNHFEGVPGKSKADARMYLAARILRSIPFNLPWIYEFLPRFMRSMQSNTRYDALPLENGLWQHMLHCGIPGSLLGLEAPPVFLALDAVLIAACMNLLISSRTNFVGSSVLWTLLVKLWGVKEWDALRATAVKKGEISSLAGATPHIKNAAVFYADEVGDSTMSLTYRVPTSLYTEQEPQPVWFEFLDTTEDSDNPRVNRISIAFDPLFTPCVQLPHTHHVWTKDAQLNTKSTPYTPTYIAVARELKKSGCFQVQVQTNAVFPRRKQLQAYLAHLGAIILITFLTGPGTLAMRHFGIYTDTIYSIDSMSPPTQPDSTELNLKGFQISAQEEKSVQDTKSKIEIPIKFKKAKRAPGLISLTPSSMPLLELVESSCYTARGLLIECKHALGSEMPILRDMVDKDVRWTLPHVDFCDWTWVGSSPSGDSKVVENIRREIHELLSTQEDQKTMSTLIRSMRSILSPESITATCQIGSGKAEESCAAQLITRLHWGCFLRASLDHALEILDAALPLSAIWRNFYEFLRECARIRDERLVSTRDIKEALAGAGWMVDVRLLPLQNEKKLEFWLAQVELITLAVGEDLFEHSNSPSTVALLRQKYCCPHTPQPADLEALFRKLLLLLHPSTAASNVIPPKIERTMRVLLKHAVADLVWVTLIQFASTSELVDKPIIQRQEPEKIEDFLRREGVFQETNEAGDSIFHFKTER